VVKQVRDKVHEANQSAYCVIELDAATPCKRQCGPQCEALEQSQDANSIAKMHAAGAIPGGGLI
jgi:hypothetical protein